MTIRALPLPGMPARRGSDAWRKLAEGDVKGRAMPLDERIGALRRAGFSLGEIARRVGKEKSYVQNRLLRIAAREG